ERTGTPSRRAVARSPVDDGPGELRDARREDPRDALERRLARDHWLRGARRREVHTHEHAPAAQIYRDGVIAPACLICGRDVEGDALDACKRAPRAVGRRAQL